MEKEYNNVTLRTKKIRKDLIDYLIASGISESYIRIWLDPLFKNRDDLKTEIETMIEANKYAVNKDWQSGYYNALKAVLDLLK